jgi:phosphoribulokinase
MVEKNTDKVNEAVEELTKVVQDSYRMAWENTAAVQESNTRLARSLYESNVKVLEAQAEIQSDIHRYTLQGMAEQIRKHREAFQELSRDSLNAYDGFLDSLSSYHKEVSKGLEEPKD